MPTTISSVRFTSCVILRVCIDFLWPKPNSRLTEEELVPFDPIKLLKYGLPHVSPAILQHPLVRNKHGPVEKSFQVALYSVFNGLLPKSMRCLFEPKAKDIEQLDLIVVSGNEKLAGYELKVNNTTEADLRKSLEQAKRYANHFHLTVHLVNFCPEGYSDPFNPIYPPTNVVLVNVRYSRDCTRFSISAPGCNQSVTVIQD